ncbi:FAD-binding oxidoreductase [Actinocatenispora rupis]|uniref:Oxidoreductase n=1 Tax=Actinocatenispora rupis TaxID=519421 RepID=A0A8J3NF11_9ACTN|nr:FAD-binding oxidoreductase [Actinocatenispora rupis]GID13229.1 oxidoreductase [Actinocatenispora rupis]
MTTSLDRVAGPVFTADDADYATETSGFNLAVTHRPDIAVGATCTADVAAAVRYAADADLPVGVQATGHGAVATIGGVLVATHRMTGLTIDPAARTATIDAGVRWRQVIDEAARYGLAPLNGSASDVGAVGYTTGGGLPVLGRAYGFAADHVRSFELVTADGTVRQVEPGTEPDLLWAVRGGKGNFGIVTRMTIDLVPVTTLYGGAIFHPGADAPRLLRLFREWAPMLPETTSASIALLRLPPIPEVPEPLRGKFLTHVRYAHVGDPEVGALLLDPMRRAATPVVDAVGEMPYTAVDAIHQDPTFPLPFYERGALLPDLPPEVDDRILDLTGPGVRTPILMLEVRQLGGALARPPEVPNAVGARGAAYCVFALGVLMPPVADAVPAAVDAVPTALAGYTSGDFVNFHGRPRSAADMSECWPAPVHRRLLDIKREYDPANRFRYGHALVPAA